MTKKQQRSIFSTTKLYSDIQSSTFSPELHDEPRPLVWIANGLGRSSEQKLTTQAYFILAIKLDRVSYVTLCLLQKIELPVMGDKTGFCRASHIIIIYKQLDGH